MTDNKSKINQLEEALDRVSKRQKVCVTKSIAQIDQLISELTKAKVLLNPGIENTEMCLFLRKNGHRFGYKHSTSNTESSK